MVVLLAFVLELVVLVLVLLVVLSRPPCVSPIVPPLPPAQLLCLLMTGATGMNSGVSALFLSVSAPVPTGGVFYFRGRITNHI